MSESIRNKGRDFAKFLESLSPDQIREGNEANMRAVEAEHAEFRSKFNEGICYLCNAPLSSFDKNIPCMHWLLNPQGFRKNDFLLIASKYGCFQIQSYLRWVANQGKFAQNINNLPEEGTSGKLVELTIKYNNIEWAFSCAETDYLGHETTNNSNFPHYHFQMTINGLPFIRYNDFHPKFSDMDIIEIEAERLSPNLVKRKFTFGEGMNDVLTDEAAEHIVNLTVPGNDEENAPFNIQTFACADEGTLINGDDLYDLIQEATEKGVTISSAPTHSEGAGRRLSLSTMASAVLVQTKGLAWPL